MMQPKRKDPAPPLHQCPVCGHPQTKMQRQLGGTTRGCTMYVCGRAGECSAGMNLSKIETWVAV